jgi:hypothetical protein
MRKRGEGKDYILNGRKTASETMIRVGLGLISCFAKMFVRPVSALRRFDRRARMVGPCDSGRRKARGVKAAENMKSTLIVHCQLTSAVVNPPTIGPNTGPFFGKKKGKQFFFSISL